jgi:hypothetical protein
MNTRVGEEVYIINGFIKAIRAGPIQIQKNFYSRKQRKTNMKQLIIFMLLALITAFTLSGCTSMGSVGLDEVQKNPANYTNKTITVVGTLSAEIAPASAEHFNYYLIQYHNYRIKLDCAGYHKTLTNNARYLAVGALSFDNATNEYSLKCSEEIIEK